MNISLKGKGNLFEQIAEEYIKLINLGVYEPGYKLPSCRVLAKELGINPNTVERAYNLLEEQNYIETIPKKGVYVSNGVKKSHINEIEKQIIEIKDKISYEELISIINNVYKG